MKNRHEVSRRNFIRQSGLSGIALTIGAYLPASDKTAMEIINVHSTDKTGIELMSWISINTSGKVTIMNHRSEMGQGTYQAIPQIIAEELEVNLDQVSILFAPANPKKIWTSAPGRKFFNSGLVQTTITNRSFCAGNAHRRSC
jgi:isoquinoline 1-oxidoreductase beta subunit